MFLLGMGAKDRLFQKNKVVTQDPGASTAANDHEASGNRSNSKYFLPRWCPPGLTHTQRRKLQRLKSAILWLDYFIA
jgi:hypothetical protein